jgi:aspartate racemase
MLGVLGGMGPLATADFLTKLTAATPAARDQEHIPVVAWSVPQIPDRVPAILGDAPSPLPAMLEGIRALKSIGAQGIAIACNTAHYWYDRLLDQGGLPIVHIADAALAEAARRAPGARRIGLLATSGTIAAGFYQARFELAGYTAMLPAADDQARLLQAIALVKSNEVAAATALAEPVAQRLLENGADVLIAGCTELPIALAGCGSALRPRLVDATAALADACVRWSREEKAKLG